jgi:hypothetical protein
MAISGQRHHPHSLARRTHPVDGANIRVRKVKWNSLVPGILAVFMRSTLMTSRLGL